MVIDDQRGLTVAGTHCGADQAKLEWDGAFQRSRPFHGQLQFHADRQLVFGVEAHARAADIDSLAGAGGVRGAESSVRQGQADRETSSGAPFRLICTGARGGPGCMAICARSIRHILRLTRQKRSDNESRVPVSTVRCCKDPLGKGWSLVLLSLDYARSRGRSFGFGDAQRC